MYAFFDKHGKKALVVAAALLILVMLLPPTAGQMGGQGGGAVGTLAGKAIDPTAVEGALRSLEILEKVEVTVPRVGPVPLPPAMFGPQIYRSFRDDPRLYYLLAREAKTSGVVANESDVSELLRDQGTKIRLSPIDSRDFSSLEQANPAYARSLEDSLRMALSVAENARHATRSIKISTPLVRETLARRTQEARIRVLAFDAAPLQEKVAKPTDAQLEEQFRTYAAIAPGSADAKDNPFAFGYRVPDRVKIDYVEVPLMDVQRVVEASKTPQEWEEEAQLLYLRDPSRFAAPATQPASSTQPAAPTTRPFAEAKADVLKTLREPLIDQRRRAVLNRIQQQLNGDYLAASDNGTATTQKVEAAAPSFGVAYSGFDYLQKVRETVQRQFGVNVRVVREAEWLSESQLMTHPTLGSAKTEGAGSELPRPAADHLFRNLKALQTAAVESTPNQINLYEPSRPLASETAAFVVRVTAVDPSHPPASLADVREQVEKDVRRKAAFEQARTAAETAEKAAANGGLAKAGNGVETSGWFKESDFRIPDLTEKPIGQDAYLLVGPAFEMLKGVRSPSDLPVRRVVPIHSANRVFVVELFDLRSTQTADESQMIAQLMAAQLQQTAAQQQGYPQAWYDRDAVFKRMQFEPAEGNRDQDPAVPPTARPGNPFIPG